RGRGPAAAAGGVLPYRGGTARGARAGLRFRSRRPCGGNPEPSRAGTDRVGRVRAATRRGGPAAVRDWGAGGGGSRGRAAAWGAGGGGDQGVLARVSDEGQQERCITATCHALFKLGYA